MQTDTTGTSMSSGAGPLVVAALRGGGSVALYADRIELPGRRIALADVTWASLVVDPGVPTPPGAWPAPAAGLQLRDGSAVHLSVADPPDAWRFLEVIYAQRPDLRQPLPPLPGGTASGGSPTGQYGNPAYGYAPHSLPPGAAGMGAGHAPGAPTSNETVLAGIAHLSIFFGPVLLPLIIWLVTRKSAPYASRQAKQAFFFHLGYVIVSVVAAIVWVAFFFGSILTTAEASPTAPYAPPVFPIVGVIAIIAVYGLMLLVLLVEYGFSIYAAVQAFQGRPYSYPFLGRL